MGFMAFLFGGARGDAELPDAERWEKRAPGWRLRCRRCTFDEPFGKYGFRKYACGAKFLLRRCPQCGRLDWMKVCR